MYELANISYFIFFSMASIFFVGFFVFFDTRLTFLFLFSCVFCVITGLFCFNTSEDIKNKSLSHISKDTILSSYYGMHIPFDLSKWYNDEIVMPLKYSDSLDPEKIPVLLEKSINRYTNTDYFVSVLSYKPYVISKDSDVRKESWFYESHDVQNRQQDYVYFVIKYKIISIKPGAPAYYMQL